MVYEDIEDHKQGQQVFLCRAQGVQMLLGEGISEV